MNSRFDSAYELGLTAAWYCNEVYDQAERALEDGYSTTGTYVSCLRDSIDSFASIAGLLLNAEETCSSTDSVNSINQDSSGQE